jgi:hypothetical protein
MFFATNIGAFAMFFGQAVVVRNGCECNFIKCVDVLNFCPAYPTE